MNPSHFIFLPLLIGIAGLLMAYRDLRGTTLVATWYWSLLALLLTYGVELRAFVFLPSELELVRYVARVSLVLPVVSLLGAKRPQDGPWNFVVLALWGVLLMPSLRYDLLRGGRLDVQEAWTIFIAILIVTTFINTCPVHFFAGLFVTTAQVLLLSEYLPLVAWKGGPASTIYASCLLAAAAMLFAISHRDRHEHKHPLDRLWLDFRRDFGMFWSLRVQERLNDAAQRYQWPIQLNWHGWTTIDGRPMPKELDPKLQRAILQTFRGLLRRFVSQAWINERLE